MVTAMGHSQLEDLNQMKISIQRRMLMMGEVGIDVIDV